MALYLELSVSCPQLHPVDQSCIAISKNAKLNHHSLVYDKLSWMGDLSELHDSSVSQFSLLVGVHVIFCSKKKKKRKKMFDSFSFHN